MLLTERLAAEFGLRWDEQTYGADADDQWGPRLNLAWQLDGATRLRASWGRFQQFQGINELQVEDGVDQFFPAQRADHAILGLERDLPADLTLRVEAYRKDYAQLRPRYENLFDPLSLVPELRWDRVAIAPDSARAEGIEWLLTHRGTGPWHGWLNYTWSRVNDREDGVDTRRSWDQTHSVGSGVAWASGPWQATVAAAWHTGWPTTPVEVVGPDRGRTRILHSGMRNADPLRRLRVARCAGEPRLHAVTRRADGVRRSHQPHEPPQSVLRRLHLRVPGRAAWCSSATTGIGCRWCRRSACSGSSDSLADRASHGSCAESVRLRRRVTAAGNS